MILHCLPLTDKQERALKYIVNILNSKGFPPTLSEIGKHLGCENLGSVFCILQGLEKKGYIVKLKRKHRGIELTDLGKKKVRAGSRKSVVYYSLSHY
jgi:repressor LexA